MNKFIRLHIGAFDQAVSGWLNTDITSHIWIAKIPGLARLLFKIGLIKKKRFEQHKAQTFSKLKYMDITKPLPLPDDSCEAVFSSHVFEHLFLDEVKPLISEIKRILIPNGICRVVVPDLDQIVKNYNTDDPTSFLNAIYEISKRSDVKNSHHTGFTGPFLSKLFNQAGFSETYICSYRVGRCPDIDMLDNRPESLFFEAVK